MLGMETRLIRISFYKNLYGYHWIMFVGPDMGNRLLRRARRPVKKSLCTLLMLYRAGPLSYDCLLLIFMWCLYALLLNGNGVTVFAVDAGVGESQHVNVIRGTFRKQQWP